MSDAVILAPAKRTYHGAMTNPARWETWCPRRGDILVCTPPKCGTTWTQAMIGHLLHGGRDLPAPISALSPWVDVDLGEAEEVAASLAAQTGRRAVKTHTPGDGFPVWDGVHVVAVYRHPLDVFLSLRKHGANMASRPDHPMTRPFDVCFEDFLNASFSPDHVDDDCLETITVHYTKTVQEGARRQLTVMHYADMIADHGGAIARLARELGIPADDRVLKEVADATSFGTMKSRAKSYAPEGGKGIWKSDTAFFDSGGTDKWRSAFTDAQVAAYDARLSELMPDAEARHWLERGAT